MTDEDLAIEALSLALTDSIILIQDRMAALRIADPDHPLIKEAETCLSGLGQSKSGP